MTDERKSRTGDFSDDDHLRLLQLTTRRVMAQRRLEARGRDAGDPRTVDIQKKDDGPMRARLTRRWRLIPDGYALYEWQQECLPLWLSRGRGTVKVATGGGKTTFALAAAQALQNEQEHDLRLVVVVPTIPLMLQWHDELRQGNVPASAKPAPESTAAQRAHAPRRSDGRARRVASRRRSRQCRDGGGRSREGFLGRSPRRG